MQENTYSIKFLKKALQYSWIIENSELEILIYEKIGFNYFELSKISKAIFYHNRFIQSILEEKNSTPKKFSEKLLSNFWKSKSKKIDELSLLSLRKIGIYFDDDVISIKNLNFFTDLNPLSQIEIIFKENFMNIEIPSPRSIIKNISYNFYHNLEN